MVRAPAEAEEPPDFPELTAFQEAAGPAVPARERATPASPWFPDDPDDDTQQFPAISAGAGDDTNGDDTLQFPAISAAAGNGADSPLRGVTSTPPGPDARPRATTTSAHPEPSAAAPAPEAAVPRPLAPVAMPSARASELAPPSAAPRSRRPAFLDQLRFLVLPLAAIALYATSLPYIHPRAMNDFGIVSVMPWQTWLAFGLLTAGFIACWRRADQATWLLVVHVLLLIFMLYGLPGLVIHEPSGPIVYRHTGITETLIRTRTVDTKIDAYFSWPGFFMGLATLVKLGGAPSALSFGTWATVGFNLLFLPPLLVVARALTRDPRLVWGSIWIFYAANWIDQDYLAPQSFAYLCYLTMLGLLLTYLRPREADPGSGRRLTGRLRSLLRVRASDVPIPATSRWTAAAVVALVVLLYTATVASHQLTPFAILIGVVALVAIGECTARGLPLLMIVILALWDIFVAHGYLSGHLSQVVSGVGDLTKATSANITQRIGGSTQHLVVVRERLLLSGGLWLLALLGMIRRFRAGFADHAAAILFFGPLLLFGLQAYGGEMILRIYFFMLPFTAFFAIAALLPGRVPGIAALARLPAALREGAVITAFSLTIGIVLAACLLARYGNERADYFAPGEMAAMNALYAQARPGSKFAVEQSYLPWKYEQYDEHKYLSVESMLSQANPPTPAQAVRRLSLDLRPAPGHPAGFVIFTRSQRVYAEMFGGVLSPGYIGSLERLLEKSPDFALLYANSDARIYERLPGLSHAR